MKIQACLDGFVRAGNDMGGEFEELLQVLLSAAFLSSQCCRSGDFVRRICPCSASGCETKNAGDGH
jgi:hypothetical protein